MNNNTLFFALQKRNSAAFSVPRFEVMFAESMKTVLFCVCSGIICDSVFVVRNVSVFYSCFVKEREKVEPYVFSTIDIATRSSWSAQAVEGLWGKGEWAETKRRASFRAHGVVT